MLFPYPPKNCGYHFYWAKSSNLVCQTDSWPIASKVDGFVLSFFFFFFKSNVILLRNLTLYIILW